MRKAGTKSLRRTVLSVAGAAALIAGGVTLSATVAGASSQPTLTLVSTPATSGTGNTYDFVFDMPAGYLTEPSNGGTQPIGQLTVSDGTNDCTTSTWTDEGEGSDGAGGDLLDASCAITQPEYGGMVASGQLNFSTTGEDSLEGDPPLNSNSVTLAPADIDSITLSNTATNSGTGNTFTVTMDIPSTLAPQGSASVADNSSSGGFCTTGTWTDEGPDGASGEYFSSTCSISTPEPAGTKVVANYGGGYYGANDYNSAYSSDQIVGSGSGTLSLSGDPVTSASGNTYTATLDASSDLAPTGDVTVTDSASNSCTATTWTDLGGDGVGGEDYSTSCSISESESGGDTVSAVYSSSDYIVSPSNTLTVGASGAVLSVNATPVTSASGNSYTVIFDASTDVVPTGTATVTDSNGNSCSTDNWSSGDGPDGAGGEYFSAGCDITQAESGGETAYASYSGTDYNTSDSDDVSVGSASADISVSGSAVASASGNTYSVTIDSPTDVAPLGTATVEDSNSNSCDASSWTDAGSDGTGGELFSTSCSITSAESGGTTVSASYSGDDYSTGASNSISVAAGSVALTLIGSPVVSASGNSYDVTADASTGIVPENGATVNDSDGGSCVTTGWADVAPDGSGGEVFEGSCTIGSAETTFATVSASYSGADYSGPSSNTLTVEGAGTITLETDPSVPGKYLASVDVTGDTAPTGTLTISDSVGGSCAVAGGWTSEGSDGDGGSLWSASCTISTPEVGGETVSGSYSGSDYVMSTSNQLTLSPVVANGLALSGTPLASPSGNSYSVALDVPVAVSPTGTATVTDSASGSCGSSAWSDAGSDGDGGEVYTARCSIATAESGGDSVSAAYLGTDYSVGASNTLYVDAPASISSASITGNTTAGDTLSAVSLGVSGYPVPVESYKWFDNSVLIGSATGETYTTNGSEVGDSITVEITETNGVGASAEATSGGVTVTAVATTTTTTTTIPTTTTTTTTIPTTTTTTTTTTTVPVTTTTISGGGGGGGGGGGTTTSTTTAPTTTTTRPPTTTTTVPSGLKPAPAPSTLPSGDYGTPVSIKIGSKAGSVHESGDGSSAVVAVPKGALPVGTVLSVYPVTTGCNVSALVPAGQKFVLCVAVTWKDKGLSPRAKAALTVIITNPAIRSGDLFYAIGADGVVGSGSASKNGTLTIKFSTSSLFLVTAPSGSVPGPVRVLFHSDSFSLSSATRATLDKLATRLRDGAHVTITGYAKGNLALAKLRAAAVAYLLVEKDHVNVVTRLVGTGPDEVVVVTNSQ